MLSFALIIDADILCKPARFRASCNTHDALVEVSIAHIAHINGSANESYRFSVRVTLG